MIGFIKLIECNICFDSKDLYIITANVFERSRLDISFCPRCLVIRVSKKKLLGGRVYFMHTTLARLAHESNYITDHEDHYQKRDKEEYMTILVYQSGLPKHLFRYLFDNEFLLIDKLGIKTKNFEYQEMEHVFMTPPPPESYNIERQLQRRKEYMNGTKKAEKIKIWLPY